MSAIFTALKDVRLDGKTVVITGGNIGLGKESALDLAGRGARIILACRDPTRGEDAAESVRQETGNTNVVFQQLDLASLKSVREFSERLHQTEERLDILMNNAGVMNIPTKSVTEDGFETQLGVNHVGHFLLTNLLLDMLKKCAPSRVVNLSSSAHEMGKMNWEDLHYEKGGYGGWSAYGQSKLANILFTKALAKRLEGTGVTTFAVHPGVVKTNLTQHTNFILTWIVRLFSKNVKQGAETQIYCAICPDLEKETGNYFADCKEKTPTALARNAEDAEKLWKLSLKWTGLPAEE